jgi:putative ATP-binding cassette transporter
MLKSQDIFRKARKDGDTLQKHFQALLHSAKELKLHKELRDMFFSSQLDRTASSFRTYNKSAMKIYTASATWGQTLVFIVVDLILLALPVSHNLSRETLTGCTLALLYLMTPLQVIMNMAPHLARANVAVRNEWAADQDSYFKDIFYLQLLPELKARGKTVFVISHDDRYYHVADRIIKFD